MKKIFIIMGILVMIMSCDGSNENSGNTENNQTNNGFVRFGDIDLKVSIVDFRRRDLPYLSDEFDAIFTIKNNGNNKDYLQIKTPCYYKDRSLYNIHMETFDIIASGKEYKYKYIGNGNVMKKYKERKDDYGRTIGYEYMETIDPNLIVCKAEESIVRY